ncbi:MAG: mechanosensitive ion channel family protein [Oscillospiraceae bacterium]|nr:mechanosensitive ion channel family protein [Oscillospiraceae bacterium]
MFPKIPIAAAPEPETVTEAVAGTAEELMQSTNVIKDFFAGLGLAGLSTVLSAVVVFLICLIVIKILTHVMDKLFSRSKHLDETVKRFLEAAIKIVLWVLAIVIIAGALGIPTASLVAVISIAGLALSLSVQTILSNLFAGVTLLLTRPMNVGDFVDAAGVTGTVERISMFYTTIVTPNKQVVTIPNSDVASSTVTNYNREDNRRVQFVMGADYEDKTEDVFAALLEAAQRAELVLSDPAPSVFISAYKDSYIEYTLNTYCENNDYWAVIADVNRLIREEYDHHGVHMTYNHLNVHMLNK